MKQSMFMAAALTVHVMGCMVGEPEMSTPTPSFAEFREQTYREPWPGGGYIVDGDTPIIDDKALEEFWSEVFGTGELIVNTSGGVDTKWTDTQKLNLTYC